MNKSLLKAQMHRQLISWSMTIIVLLSFAMIFLEFKTTNDWLFIKSNNFLHYVLVIDRYSKAGAIYLVLMPFMAALLGGTLYRTEAHSGRLTVLQARMSRPAIMKTTFLSSFLLGGIGVLVPMAISLIVAFIRLPHMKMLTVNNSQFPIFDTNFWGYRLYAHSQILILLLLLSLLFVFGGLMALTATTISFFTKIKYVEILLPFVGSIIFYLVVSVIGFPEWGHIVFLDFPITEGFRHTPIYLILTYLILVVGNIILLNREANKDGLS